MHGCFMNDKWDKISRDREMLDGRFGIKIIRPIGAAPGYSNECEICRFLIRGLEDIHMLDKFGCCQECAFQWAQPHRHKWENGWRPSGDEIKTFIIKRMNGIN